MGREGEAAIWRRVIDGSWRRLSPELARAVLRVRFDGADLDRFNELSHLAQEGHLSEAQDDELKQYLRVGGVLAIMQSRARRILKEGENVPRRKVS